METILQEVKTEVSDEIERATGELAREQELTIPEAATGLSMSSQTLAGMDGTSNQVTDLDAEVTRLKRELAEARLQCDILKQTVAYFAQMKLPGTRS